MSGTQDEMKRLESIYICHFQAINRALEYKIDFKDRKIWEYRFADNGKNRDEAQPNEGYVYVGKLADHAVATFLSEADEHGFYHWEERYTSEYAGGHWWLIQVVFSDGTVKDSHGFQAYPRTWDAMKSAFLRLTGKEVLLVSR